MAPTRRRARLAAALIAGGAAIAVASCTSYPVGGTSATPVGTPPAPSVRATLYPSAPAALQLPGEPSPGPGATDPLQVGLEQHYKDPYGWFTVDVPPGNVDVKPGTDTLTTGPYQEPTTSYTTKQTPSNDQLQIHDLVLPDMLQPPSDGDIAGWVTPWEEQQLDQLASGGTLQFAITGPQTGTVNSYHVIVFTIAAADGSGNSLYRKVAVVVYGKTLFILSADSASDNPPRSFIAFVSSFHILGPPTPPTPKPSPSPSPSGSPTPTPGPQTASPSPGSPVPAGGETPPPV